MNVRRSVARTLQAIVIGTLIVGGGAFAAGVLGLAGPATITWVAFTAASVGALAVLAHAVLTDPRIRHHS
jgi:hypothetical protein